MIIAPNNFRDEELLEPKKVLEGYGTKVTIASQGVSEAKGALGATVPVDKDISEVNVDNYDAVIFVGGQGSSVYFSNSRALEIAKESYSKGKITSAICIAPSILANAGILEGKRATVFSSESSNLEEKGATYTDEDVTQDGKIITASGPQAAKEFGETIARELAK